jgi:hypothetical protein
MSSSPSGSRSEDEADELAREQMSILSIQESRRTLDTESLAREIDQASTAASSAGSQFPVMRTAQYPWLPVLYSISREDCGTRLSTESGCRGTWQHWAAYSATRGRDAFTHGRGLGLYLDHAVSMTDERHDAQAFDRGLISGFFKYLSVMDGATKNTMTKAKTFMNSHLKCELYALLVLSNSKTDPYISPHLCVGKELQVINACTALKRGTAKRALDECLDLMGDLDDRISNMQIRSMMESVFIAKPGTSHSSLD